MVPLWNQGSGEFIVSYLRIMLWGVRYGPEIRIIEQSTVNRWVRNISLSFAMVFKHSALCFESSCHAAGFLLGPKSIVPSKPSHQLLSLYEPNKDSDNDWTLRFNDHLSPSLAEMRAEEQSCICKKPKAPNQHPFFGFSNISKLLDTQKMIKDLEKSKEHEFSIQTEETFCFR